MKNKETFTTYRRALNTFTKLCDKSQCFKCRYAGSVGEKPICFYKWMNDEFVEADSFDYSSNVSRRPYTKDEAIARAGKILIYKDCDKVCVDVFSFRIDEFGNVEPMNGLTQEQLISSGATLDGSQYGIDMGGSK